ncbi:methyltransferase domain-containing protein [Tardiphaga sp. vice278]|uniref:methyltransferase domain-containing protein n=1 Tax=Tardiphaga sp. vice278 TaxID=2592815 RepID=UPI0011659857|nr:methyltransferase domain-containing protein [Tardiphaga sp. vice278]QDM17932.1 class I SAM-dependent methyltransferase [Tardiphaga sp. vice278]
MFTKTNVHFDLTTYRAQNPDLAGFSDGELAAHFKNCGFREKRCYAAVDDDHERFSMRWLRGKGIEIGAGSSPTRLFGDATTELADVDASLKFGGSRYDQLFSLDDPQLTERMGVNVFDFAIASHVLEHVDSFLRGLKNLIDLVRPDGIVYVSLPIKEYLYDKHWMPFYPFAHHVEEFAHPLKFADGHDRLIIGEHEQKYEAGGDFTIAQQDRFLHHKHNYDLHDWTALLFQSLEFLGGPARVVDSGFGRQRQDCNFVLQKLAATS